MLFKKNLILIIFVILLVVAPLIIIKDSDFGGADSKVSEMIEQSNPDYKIWFSSIISPPGSETESLIFSLQAAIGAGVVGFILGRITKKEKTIKEEKFGDNDVIN